MQITLEIPDETIAQLQTQWQDLPQRMLEILAAEAYRRQILTAAEVRQMLRLPSRMAVDAFLKKEGLELNYTQAEVEQEIQAVAEAVSES